jgi:hypothetical protein
MPVPENTNETSFSLSLAGLGVVIHCDHPTLVKSLQSRYQDFPLKNQPQLSLEITCLGQERTSASLETGTVLKDDGVYFTTPGYRGFISTELGTGKLTLSSINPEEEIDYFIRVAYALLAFQVGGVMLHAAGIVRDGLAYLFFGHSGSGKTTIARLSPGIVLNDDLVILLPEGNVWRAFGSPFWNHSQVKPAALSAPVTALFWLEQSKRVQLEPLSDSQAIAEMVANVPVIPADSLRSATLLERLYRITQTTPVKKLSFLPDASFWNVIQASLG